MDNTGQGQMEILSELASSQFSDQQSLVDSTSLSKGAVSTNLSKLEDRNLVERGDDISIDREGLKAHYREHLEGFLGNDPELSDETRKIRREVKKRIKEIIEDQNVEEVLLELLRSSVGREDLESLNSVFKETDRILRELPNKNKEIKLLAAVTDFSTEMLESSEADQIVEEILQEVENEQ